MISYSNYKLIREAGESPATPAAPPSGGSPGGAPPAGAAPPMGGGMPDAGMGGRMPGMPDAGMPAAGSGTGTKPEGIKSSNVWDTLEKYLSK